MNVLFIVEDINSATGYCVQEVAKVMTDAGYCIYIMSREPANEKIKGCLYFNTGKTSRLPIRIQVLTNLYRWPIKNKQQIESFVALGDSIVSKYHVSVIVAVYNSIEAILAGIKLKNKYSRIKLVSYFLDALYKGQCLSFLPTKFCEKKALRIQTQIIMKSDKSVIMRSVEQDFMDSKMEALRDKVVFLDIPLLNLNNTVKHCSMDNIGDGMHRFIYVGSFPRNVRDPRYMFELFSHYERVELFVYGKSDYPEYEKKYRASKNIHFMGTVTRNEATEAMINADVVINLSNKMKSMVPSKIFEYIQYGKKILSLHFGEEDPCIKYLEAYGRYISVRNGEDIKKTIDKIEGWKNEIDNITIVDSDYLYKNTPEAFMKEIEKI